MTSCRKRHPRLLVASVVCLAISAVAFGGLILKADITGRVIFGAVWAVLGVVWLGGYFGAFSGRSGDSPKQDRTS